MLNLEPLTSPPHPIVQVLAMRRITVRALAREVDYNVAHLSCVLNGRRRPGRRLRRALSEALGLPEDHLFDGRVIEAES